MGEDVEGQMVGGGGGGMFSDTMVVERIFSKAQHCKRLEIVCFPALLCSVRCSHGL